MSPDELGDSTKISKILEIKKSLGVKEHHAEWEANKGGSVVRAHPIEDYDLDDRPEYSIANWMLEPYQEEEGQRSGRFDWHYLVNATEVFRVGIPEKNITDVDDVLIVTYYPETNKLKHTILEPGKSVEFIVEKGIYQTAIRISGKHGFTCGTAKVSRGYHNDINKEVNTTELYDNFTGLEDALKQAENGNLVPLREISTFVEPTPFTN